MGMGAIMGVLGRGYREEKEMREKQVGGKGAEVVEVVEVGSDGDGNGVGESTRGLDLDAVARKLDFLSLRGEAEG